MFRSKDLRIPILLVALCFIGSGAAEAGKSKTPPPAPVDSGAIYYYVANVGLYCMEPDGSSKTKIASSNLGAASQALHDGERWFLQFMVVDTGTYPSGEQRQELFAVDEHGIAHQLTSDPCVEPNPGNTGIRIGSYRPAWTSDGSVVDGKASFLGRTWAQDDDGEWYMAGWGLYVVTLDPDALADHVPAYPTLLPVEFDLLDESGDPVDPYADLAPGIVTTYAWAPDGTAFVYDRRGHSQPGLWLGQPSGGTWTEGRLTTDGISPSWSKKGQVGFLSGSGDIDVMDPDGSNRTTIVGDPADTRKTWTMIGNPYWSPAGTHLVYRQYTSGNSTTSDVRRVTATGSDSTNLTGDISGSATPTGWTGD